MTLDVWRATPGSEARVQEAAALSDDPIDLDATRRFLASDANALLIAYVDGAPAGFVSRTEPTHHDKRTGEARAHVIYEWGET